MSLCTQITLGKSTEYAMQSTCARRPRSSIALSTGPRICARNSSGPIPSKLESPESATKLPAGMCRSRAYSLATVSDAQLSAFTTTTTDSGDCPASASWVVERMSEIAAAAVYRIDIMRRV